MAWHSRGVGSSLSVVAITIAFVMVATVFPVVSADATVGIDPLQRTASVDIDGRWAVVGDEIEEQVYLYRYEAGGWTLFQTILPPTSITGFGHAVSVDASRQPNIPTVVIGAGESNLAFAYLVDGATGDLIGPTTFDAPVNAEGFGSSVDIDRDGFVVGAPLTAQGRGSAFLYQVGDIGPQIDNPIELTEPAADAGAAIGAVVKIQDGQVFAGAPGQGDQDEGAVFVFETGVGVLTDTVKSDNPVPTERFGTSLDTDIGRLIIGTASETFAYLQTGLTQTVIAPTFPDRVVDVAISGNLVALYTDGFVHIFSDNGQPGTFVDAGIFSTDGDDRQISLAGGQAFVVGAQPPGIDAQVEIFPITLDVPGKILPDVGRTQGNLGNRIDADGTTMVSARGQGTATGDIVVFDFDGQRWVETQVVTRQVINGQGIATVQAVGAVAIQGDFLAALLLDGGDASLDHVAVYRRVQGQFQFLTSFRNASGLNGRSIAIHEDGNQLAVGIPSVGQVEVHFGAPGVWGTSPQVIVPEDQAGNGPQTFGHAIDFGDGFLLIGKPETASLTNPAPIGGTTEMWRDNGGSYGFFSSLPPTTSTPGDAAGWSVAIGDGDRVIGSPGIEQIQMRRSGQGDFSRSEPAPTTGDYWGYALDLDRGVLVVTDWDGDVTAYDTYADSVVEIANYQAPDREPSDAVFSTFPLVTDDGNVFLGAWLEDEQGRDAGAIYNFSVTLPDPPPVDRSWSPAVAIDAQWAVVGNPEQDLVHVLFNDGNGWAETQQLNAPAGGEGDFGAGVAMDGNRLAVGAPDAFANAGQVTTWIRDSGGNYTQAGSWDGDNAEDSFGSVLHLAGDLIVAGRPVQDGVGGALGATFDLQNIAQVGSGAVGDGYGSSVATNTVTLPTGTAEFVWVGAPAFSDNTGQVIGYLYNGDTFDLIDTDFGDEPGDFYGVAIEPNGAVLAATAPRSGGAIGYVRTRQWNASGLVGSQTTVNGVGPLGDSVVFNGNQLAVGSVEGSETTIYSNNGQAGTAEIVAIYGSNGAGRSIDMSGLWLIAASDAASTDWTDLTSLVRITDIGSIPNTPDNKTVPEFGSDADRYGAAVAMNDDVWIVGSPNGTSTAGNGVVRVYDRASGELLQLIDGAAGEGFGQSLSVAGDRLVIGSNGLVQVLDRAGAGAPFTLTQELIGENGYGYSVDTDGTLLAIGSPLSDDQAGVVHILEETGGAFVEVAGSPFTTFLASADDFLGASVAVNGNVVVAGADRSFPTDTFVPGELGYVAVYARTDAASSFIEQAALTGDEGVLDQFDGYGRSLDFDGNRLVVGAPLEDRNAVGDAENQGVVYVHNHAGGGDFSGGVLLDPRSAVPGDSVQAQFGSSVAVSGDSIVAGGPGHLNTAGAQGALVHYRFDAADGVWLLDTFVEGDAVATDADAGDRLGGSVAASGTSVIAGAPGEDAGGLNAGAVYQFNIEAPVIPEPDDKILSEVGVDLTDDEVGDLFGQAIDTDGTRLVIGAPEWVEAPQPVGDAGSGGTGGAFVYARVAGGWQFETYLANPDPDAIESKFGQSVSVDGDLVAVGGAAEQFSDFGTVWVFDLATGQSVEVTPGDLGSTSQYGQAVDLQDGTLVVGASGYDFDAAGDLQRNIGKVYIWNGNVADGFNLITDIFGTEADLQFGRRLSLDGSGLAIGSLAPAAAPGTVTVYRNGAQGWVLEQTFTGSSNGGQFGLGVDLDENLLIVGAPGAEQATIYTNTDGVWDVGQLLSPGVVDPGDNFGFSVAIEGTVAVVGEAYDDNAGQNEGRIHAFGITQESLWELLDVFIAPDGADNDTLGWAVDLTGGDIIAGAPTDDNNNGLDAGAAYEFAVTPPPPPPPPPPPVDPATITVSYELPETVMPGATSVTIEGATVATLDGSDGATASGVVAASLGAIDFDEPPTGSSAVTNPLGDVTLGELGLAALGLDALNQIPLTEFPIDGGWGPILAGTVYQDVPLQIVTLGDVYSLPNVQSIPLRFADINASPLRFADVAAAALGSIPITSIDLDGDPATDAYTEWCDAIALQASSCADLGIDPTSPATLGSISAAGVSLEATPLRFAPLRFAYIEASPLRFAPLRFADIEASPLRFAPLRFAGIESSPLRFAPLRFAPLRFAPLRFAPLRFAPLRFADINATPLRFAPLRFATNPGAIADCTIVDCDTATIGQAADAGALFDDFTFDDLGDVILGDLRIEDIEAGLDEATLAALQAILDGDDTITLDTLLAQFGIDGLGDLTLGDLDQAVFDLIELTIGDFFGGFTAEELDNYSIADFLLLFIPRTAYEWDEVDLATINIQSAGLQAPITASVAFQTTDGEPTNDVTVTIDLPASAIAEERSFRLAPTGASITSTEIVGQTAIVSITNVAPDEPQVLQFSLLQGLTLGTAPSAVTATVDDDTQSDNDSVTIVEAFEPENNSLIGSVPVLANNLYLSHIGSPGDLDYYRITVTEPGTAVSLRLGNLGTDLDMVVYGPRLDSIVPDSGDAAPSAPDADFGTGSSSGALSPVPLNDLPSSLEQLQAYGASYFRGTDAEQIDFVAIEPGDYFVQITGYLGASSPEPYSLRAAVTPTVELPCPAREFPFTGGTLGGSSSVSPAADTIVVMNRSRLELIYGPDAATDIVTATEAMIAAANGSGTVFADILDVDAIAGAEYAAWDANPCSVLAVNNVVGTIANAILGIRASQTIDNVLVIGGDDVIPFGRVKDGTNIANEQSYTNTFVADSNNALRTAFSESFVLTDDPYADSAPQPIANTDRVVYVPELAIGRLVENPVEIISSLTHYVDFNGQLDPQTGFVAGYDFLDDGAEVTGDKLEQLTSPGAVQRLINETWTAADLNAGLSTAPDAALVSAHFDHYNALPAAGNATSTTDDLFDVTDASNIDYDGAILFSVGCHGGLSVSDVLIAPTGVVSQDWAQTFLGNGAAAFVGNTGYGYGDDTAVALSEQLMANFADGLDEYATVGEALLYAKQDYSSNLTVYGAFDEKALMEATFYGIPFYGLGNVIVEEPVPDVPTEDAPTGGQSYTESFDPVIEVTGDGTEDEVWSTRDEDGEDQVQVTNGYPILPRYQWEVTQQDPGNEDVLELEARGVVLESLVTRDEINVDPATARAVYDLAANEPNTDASEVTFALAPSVSTFLTPEGVRQNVNMAVGAFEAQSPDGSGTMRLFESFEATVYYAANPDGDRTKPVISEVQSNPAGGSFDLSVRVHDESEVVRTLALVTPMPVPNVPTTWQLLELEPAGGTLWQGAAELGSENIQWLVMAVDANGNTAWSMSKDLAFDGGLPQTSFAPVLTGFVEPPPPVLAGEPVDLEIDVIDFDGSSDSLSLNWDFGDGSGCNTSSGGTCELTAPTDGLPRGNSTATHIYTDPGTYEIRVTVTDMSGLTDTFVYDTVTVIDPADSGALIARGLFWHWPAHWGGNPDDVLPPGWIWRLWNVNVRVGDPWDSGAVDRLRFRTRDFDLQATNIDFVDVDGDMATVYGTATINGEEPVTFIFTANEWNKQIQMRVWELGANTDTTPPTYQISGWLWRRRAIRIFE